MFCLKRAQRQPGLTGHSADNSGISRVVEALQSHAWDFGGLFPSMYSDDRTDLFDEDADAKDILGADPLHGPLPSGNEVDAMHRSIFGGIDDEGGIEETIAKLQKLRDLGSTLPAGERQTLAAQVGLAFLKQFDEDSDI